MRASLLGAALLAAIPLLAQRVEYGKPRELRDVQHVYVHTKTDDAFRDTFLRELNAELPMLETVDAEENADLTVSMSRREVSPASGDSPAKFSNAIRAARGGSHAIRLYLDETTSDPTPDAAAHSLVKSLKHLLQGANPAKFGVPDNEALKHLSTGMIHSTAGLHAGMSKREVLLSIGTPTKVDSHGFTETWVYVTSDGTMRLIFGGQNLISAEQVK